MGGGTWKKSIPGQRSSWFKGPEAGMSQAGLENGKAMEH